MANTCFTTYAVTGPREALTRLQGDLKATSDPRGGWHENRPWIGNFLQAIGHDPDKELDNYGTLDKGCIRFRDGEEVLEFIVESSWSRCECLDTIIAEHYGVQVWFLEEEFSEDVFNTNDSGRRYFPEYIAIDVMEDDGELEYHDEPGARKRLRELFSSDDDFRDIDFDKAPLDVLVDAVYQSDRDINMHVATTID